MDAGINFDLFKWHKVLTDGQGGGWGETRNEA